MQLRETPRQGRIFTGYGFIKKGAGTLVLQKLPFGSVPYHAISIQAGTLVANGHGAVSSRVAA